MGFWSMYDVRADVVYDELDDIINAALGGTTGGGGAPPPKPEPQAQPPPPEGFRPVPGTNRVANTAGTVSMSWNAATGAWDRSPYPPSADDKRAAGVGYVGTTGTGGGTTYTRTPYGPNQLADIEGRTIPRRGSQESRVDPRTGEVFTRGGDGTWRGGYFANARDVQADVSAFRTAGATLPGTPPAAAVVPGNPGREGFAGLAGTLGTLTPTQTPQLESFRGSVLPGYGVPTEGRQYMYSGSGLNYLTAQPRSASGIGGGPVVEPRPFQARQAGLTDRQFIFNQGRGGGQVLAQKEFESVPISVPLGYTPGRSGFSLDENGGAFRAFDIPINSTAATADTPGGVGFAQLTGPTTMNIGNTGYLTSGMAYNDPLAVYGRQGSNDAATRAVQVAQIVDERNALLERGYSPGQVIDLLTATKDDENDVASGEGIMRGYATGTRGGIATAPLGGRPDQVTNEPVIAIGMMTGKPHFIAGEDNGDADTKPNPEMIHITPMRGYATGTTGGVATAAPATYKNTQTGITTELSGPLPGWEPVEPEAPAPTLPPTPTASPPPTAAPPTAAPPPVAAPTPAPKPVAPPLPTLPQLPPLTLKPVIDTGPEIETALRTARIAQQQQQEGLRRARAGLGGTTGIRTNARLTGLAPGYYTLPADYSEQIGALQTQLAGLGPISADPSSLLTFKNQLSTYLDPLKEAQGIETKLLGLGETGDPAALQQEINALKLQAGPLATIQEAQQKLAELGSPHSEEEMANLYNFILGMQESISNLGNPDPFANPFEFQTQQQWKSALGPAQNQLSQMQQKNNAIANAQGTIQNLLAANNTTLEQLAPQLAEYSAQLDVKEQAYANAQKAAELRNALANYVPEGTDVSGRIGQILGLSDQAQSAYDATLKAGEIQSQIQNYRDSTEIQGFEQNEAPPAVVQQTVVTTPALKTIAQSDPTSANALARVDYALSNDSWTPATSQLLVNLTNSLNGSKAKDAVQAMLQSLLGRMATARGVPPALAQAATTGNGSQVAAAAKFAQAA